MDTTQAKPVPWICFVCSLRASGAGGRLPGTWSIRPETQPATGPRTVHAAARGVFSPHFLSIKLVNSVTTTSVFIRGKRGARVRFDGKQGRIYENTGPMTGPGWRAGSQLMTFFARTGIFRSDTTSAADDQFGVRGCMGRGLKFCGRW